MITLVLKTRALIPRSCEEASLMKLASRVIRIYLNVRRVSSFLIMKQMTFSCVGKMEGSGFEAGAGRDGMETVVTTSVISTHRRKDNTSGVTVEH